SGSESRARNRSRRRLRAATRGRASSCAGRPARRCRRSDLRGCPVLIAEAGFRAIAGSGASGARGRAPGPLSGGGPRGTENVVPLRVTPQAASPRPELSSSEQSAFHEIARELGARIEEANGPRAFGRRGAPDAGTPDEGGNIERRTANDTIRTIAGERALL